MNNKMFSYILVNIFVLFIVSTILCFMSTTSSYWNIGPSDTLIVIAVLIDTWTKYLGLLVVITIVNITKIISKDIRTSSLEFILYNPDKTYISNMSRKDFQTIANLMFMIMFIQEVFSILIVISQFDIAIYDALVKGFVTFYTTNQLLKNKVFFEDEFECNLDYITIQ